MSEKDRQKWETRYRGGAYKALSHPSAYLVQSLPLIVPSANKALDLACGAGRNSYWLAAQGYQLDAVDISAQALHRSKDTARSAGLKGISWHQLDLDEGLPARFQGYGLIIMLRYLDIALLQTSTDRLLAGGYLLAEVHLQTDQSVAGPSGSEFRAAPGELRNAAEGLDIIDYFEGIVVDPDGRHVALARMLAKKN